MINTKDNFKDEKKKDEGKDKRKEFIKALENKLLDFGQNILKTGFSSLAISQINKTEDRIKEEIEKKYQKYQKKIFKSVFLIIAAAFIFYGLLSLIMFKLNLSEYTNLIFGGIFLLAYLLLNSSKL